jgi:hypothetical protein
MKRSQINSAIQRATEFFQVNGWILPPNPAWDVTDFGLGDFDREGLVLVNLADEPEYSEKLIFAEKHQKTPAHCHHKKKEDIICRVGLLVVEVWPETPATCASGTTFQVQINNEKYSLNAGSRIRLKAGERLTVVPGTYHSFYPELDGCIIGEVSTANDDINDNFFVNPKVGRFSEIEEDESALVKLISY